MKYSTHWDIRKMLSEKMNVVLDLEKNRVGNR